MTDPQSKEQRVSDLIIAASNVDWQQVVLNHRDTLIQLRTEPSPCLR